MPKLDRYLSAEFARAVLAALVVLGSVATLDTDWHGAPAQALLRCARQLSMDIGHRP